MGRRIFIFYAKMLECVKPLCPRY